MGPQDAMESQTETPRSARQPADPSQQQLRPLNRNILSTVASLLSEGTGPSEAGNASSKAMPRFTSAHSAPRRAPGTSRLEHEAARRRTEHAAQRRLLLQTRKEDEGRIQERRVRSVQAREARFEGLLEDIRREDPLRVEASRTIAEHEAEKARKRHELHGRWDAQVAQRVERQLLKYSGPASARADPGFRERLRASDHPGSQELRQQQAEERFHQAAALVLEGSPRAEVRERQGQRVLVQQAVANREGTRPMLPVEAWGQIQHHASPLGGFAQGCERGTRSLSARRMGASAHCVDESDGVPAAGKTRTRFARNLLGMLEGSLAREGEAARHKLAHGASSGAPCQDHFFYPQGNEVVDAEFPVGRRCYPHLCA